MKTTKTLALSAAVLFALIVGCSSVDSHRKAVMDKLEGNWVCASAVVNGKPLAQSTVQLLRLTLSSERYITRKSTEVLFDSTYTTDAKQNPKQINIVGTEGDLKGKAAQGIYSLAGDTLTLCYTMPGKQRPTAFESAPGSEAHLTIWKRQTP